MQPFNVSRILLLTAMICFVLAFFGVNPYGDMIALGLALWAGSSLT